MNTEFPFEVGDEFQGSAAESLKFLRSVHSAGGKAEIDGRIVRILSLPPKQIQIVEPVVEEPVVEEPVVEEPVVEIQKEFIPKRRGRPAKFEQSE